MSSGWIPKTESEKIDLPIDGETQKKWKQAKIAIVRVVSKGQAYFADDAFKWLPWNVYFAISRVWDWQERFMGELAQEGRITVIRYQDHKEDIRWILLPKQGKTNLQVL